MASRPDQHPDRRDWPDNVRPLYREEYEKLVELGAFTDQRVELLEGQVVEMSPQGIPHAVIVAHLARRMNAVLPKRLLMFQHSGLRAGERSTPEPDISLVGFKRGWHAAENASLVVEVADSSLQIDRGTKATIYAKAGAPEYWIVDVKHEQVIVHTIPRSGRYQNIIERKRGQRVHTPVLPRLVVTVDDIIDC
ncbi:MAG TPA: Uma2 family endonuclease [Kofleriaceae bacterium]